VEISVARNLNFVALLESNYMLDAVNEHDQTIRSLGSSSAFPERDAWQRCEELTKEQQDHWRDRSHFL
jgi:hypothetical protein